jgi:predicted Holliday junction resolvase-like endonuclease
MISDFWVGLIIGAVSFSLLLIFIMWLLVKRIARSLFGKWAEKKLSWELNKSLEAQRHVIKGKISEQLFPLLYEKAGNLSDFRFIGSPIDYIVFEGLSDGDASNDKVDIKFIEVKTGNARLSSTEERIKNAVEDKRVTWEEITI